jgi:hypothetical protein
MNSQDIRSLQEAYMEVVENQQLDELSVNKMHDYINKAEKDRDRLNKKWDQGTATPKERKKVFDREEGEARASKKIKQKTGKDSFRLNALDKLKSAITKEQTDLYDIILSHLLDEGYAETPEAAEAIMVNMSEEWRDSIVEDTKTVLAPQGGVAGAVKVKQTKTPGFLGIGSKTVNTPIPGTWTRDTPGRQASGPRSFDASGSGSRGG